MFKYLLPLFFSLFSSFAFAQLINYEVSPTGKYIVAQINASPGSVHKIFSAETESIIAELPGAYWGQMHSVFTPDEKYLIYKKVFATGTWGTSYEFAFFNLATLSVEKTFYMNDTYYDYKCIVFDTSGSQVAFGCNWKDVQVFNLKTWETDKLYYNDSSDQIQFTPDGKSIVLANDHQEVVSFEIKTGKKKALPIDAFTYLSADGLYFTTYDGFWNIKTGKETRPKPWGLHTWESWDREAKAMTVSFENYSKDSNDYKVYDFPSIKQIASFSLPRKLSKCCSTIVSKNRKYFLAASPLDTVAVWDLLTQVKQQDFVHPGTVEEMKLSADSQWLVTHVKGESQLRIWKMDDPKKAAGVLRFPTQQ